MVSTVKQVSAHRSDGTESVSTRRFPLLRKLGHQFVYENGLAGRIVQWRGNRVKVSGMTFSVDDPSISLPLKGRFLFGVWEKDETRLITKYIDPTHSVVELGGCMGVVSCLTHRLLEKPARHVVVEANPRLIPLLEHNRELNHCDFEIVHGAIAYGSPSVDFYIHDLAVGGSLQRPTNTKVTVPTLSLSDIMERHKLGEITLIVDIEGGEIDLIRHELELIRKRVRTLWIETHARIVGDDANSGMLRAVESAGFRLTHREDIQYIFQNQEL